MKEYKGIYHEEEKEQKFYEHGAHFKYSSLYLILEYIANKRASFEHNIINSQSFKNNVLLSRNNKLSSNVSQLNFKSIYF